MVLDHIPKRTGLLVVRAAPFHADRFRRRDLHVVDIGAVPERLENPVAETERHDVLDGLFAEIVVDPVDLTLVEALLQAALQHAGAVEIMTEGLFDDDAPPALTFVQTRGGKSFCDFRILARLGGEVEQDVVFGFPRFGNPGQVLAEFRVGSGVAHIAGDVGKTLGERLPEFLIEGRIFQKFPDGIMHPIPELVVRHGGAGHADHGEARGKPALIGQPVECRHQLTFGEIAVGSVDHHRARRRLPVKPERILQRCFLRHHDHSNRNAPEIVSAETDPKHERPCRFTSCE